MKYEKTIVMKKMYICTEWHWVYTLAEFTKGSIV